MRNGKLTEMYSDTVIRAVKNCHIRVTAHRVVEQTERRSKRVREEENVM
jgi:hypothetical protein